MITEEIKSELIKLQDVEYRDFQSKLIPNIGIEYFIGVRTPELRMLAKTVAKRADVEEFLQQLPHEYFDENQLHAFILSEMKDYDKCLKWLQEFLPFVNNWATCDQMSPKVFKKHKSELLPLIDEWIASGETYSIRFGIKMLMEHFLDEDFDIAYPEKVAAVRSEEYYVNMMIAWYFATALAKQYDKVLPFIEDKKLDVWCHNKAIQKSVESYRITPEQKEYLRGLKIK
ncbi:Predicted DNA alkylation repair enzyme [Butyrivibrio fibrisolvens 16/4]|nr:Predicted DNA alkylation repair enzyme [Butyrivibrio fibrisolvens 16/4]